MKLFRGLKDSIKYCFFDNTYFMNYLILLISLFNIEMIVKLINGYSIISWSTLRIFVGLNIISIIISFLLSYLKSWMQKVISCLIVFAVAAYSCIQLGFLKFLGVYASLQSANQAGAVTDYISDFLKSFNPVFLCTFIPFVYILVFYLFHKRRLYKVNHLRTAFISVIALAFISCGYYEMVEMDYFQNDVQSISNHELFLTASNPSLTVSEFGTIGFCILDARNAAFPIEIATQLEISSNKSIASSEHIKGIDDGTWQYIIDNETDENYKYLSTYFYNRDKATKNDMTGVFKDKNLIVIMMESANDIFLEYPDYYPNIAKLLNGGWSWENYYSPRNSCATLNNEFSGMTSLYSISNTCTAKTYIDNTYFESIFNVFNKSGYYSFSAHDYTEHYYPRNTIHRNLGSQEYYGVESLGISYDDVNYKNWAYDDEFMSSILNILDGVTSENDHFMTWLTTVSSHQPYNRDSNQGNKYYSMTDGTGYNSEIRRYMSKLKILDDAIGVLVAGLEEKGILDDTVIVLYGDHYPYGIKQEILNTVMSYDTSVDMNAEQVPFIIYNSEVTEKNPYVYTDYTTYVNILPTLANLFAIDYESRLYLGDDLFSENYSSLAVFADGSWKNEDAYYDAQTGKIKYYSSFEYTTEELRKINDNVYAMLSVSSKAVTSNYFAHLKEQLDEYETRLNELAQTACLMRDKEYYCGEATEENKELETNE